MKDVLNNPLFHKNAMYDMIQGIEDLSVRKRDSKLYKRMNRQWLQRKIKDKTKTKNKN